MRRPLVLDLYASPMTGEEIEALSFQIIDREAPSHSFTPQQWQVVRRMIHTTGDFAVARDVRFSPDAVEAAIEALRRRSAIYVDAQMIRAGLSLARLRSACPEYEPGDILCCIADPDVAESAARAGLPRSPFAVRKARPRLDGALAVFGNAPVALMELNRMILEEGVRPALVLGLPVGFVHVEQSKEELMSLGVPYIALAGRRGGSPLAVCAVHALCGLAAERRTPWNAQPSS